MTKAKITKKDGYTCYPDGVTKTHYAHGDVVHGKVADWAVAERAASVMLEKKPSKVKLETKGKAKK